VSKGAETEQDQYVLDALKAAQGAISSLFALGKVPPSIDRDDLLGAAGAKIAELVKKGHDGKDLKTILRNHLRNYFRDERLAARGGAPVAACRCRTKPACTCASAKEGYCHCMRCPACACRVILDRAKGEALSLGGRRS
jgi:hypothetical protein